MAFDLKPCSKGLPLAAGGLLFACSVAAEEWPRVPFPEWPRISVSQITQPVPLLPSSAPGSVTNEYRRRPHDANRQCNRRQSDGTYIPVKC